MRSAWNTIKVFENNYYDLMSLSENVKRTFGQMEHNISN